MNRHDRRRRVARTRRQEKTYERVWRGYETQPAESLQLLARMTEAAATFYHGGAPGLRPGDVLLPAAVTGADPRRNGDVIPERSRHVFITKWVWVAADYARLYPGGGMVYIVEPSGEVCHDPEIGAYRNVYAHQAGLKPEEIAPPYLYCASAVVVRRMDESEFDEHERMFLRLSLTVPMPSPRSSATDCAVPNG